MLDTITQIVLFTIAIIWFLLVTAVFLTIVMVIKGRDEVQRMKEQINLSEKKIEEIHKHMTNIKDGKSV
ncbi:MAG TPA: hypothetical protein VK436_13055 [Methanocella sp.]|nr:hypothetical protein [Methanocella sp.]